MYSNCIAYHNTTFQNEFMAQSKGKKESKDVAIAFRFRAKTKAHLKTVAAFHNRSMSNLIEILIEEAYEKLEITPHERKPALARNKK